MQFKTLDKLFVNIDHAINNLIIFNSVRNTTFVEIPL